MSITVTSNGKVLDRELRYETTCKSCGTVYTYQWEDVSSYSPDADGISVTGVSCPNRDCRVIRHVYRSAVLREKTVWERLFG